MRAKMLFKLRKDAVQKYIRKRINDENLFWKAWKYVELCEKFNVDQIIREVGEEKDRGGREHERA